MCSSNWCHIIIIVGSTNAGGFTNGFPNVLVANVFRYMNTKYILYLIPEMNFTCNGTIVGFTVAGRQRTGPRSTDDPIIQIWRQNSSNVYYKTNGSDIAMACAETFSRIVFQGSNINDQVWECNLSAINLHQVTVQAGDILGLLLPPRNNVSFHLSFARVSRGPTNYTFEEWPLLAVDLDVTRMNSSRALPQIAVQVESGMQSYLLDFVLPDFHHIFSVNHFLPYNSFIVIHSRPISHIQIATVPNVSVDFLICQCLKLATALLTRKVLLLHSSLT